MEVAKLKHLEFEEIHGGIRNYSVKKDTHTYTHNGLTHHVILSDDNSIALSHRVNRLTLEELGRFFATFAEEYSVIVQYEQKRLNLMVSVIPKQLPSFCIQVKDPSLLIYAHTGYDLEKALRFVQIHVLPHTQDFTFEQRGTIHDKPTVTPSWKFFNFPKRTVHSLISLFKG